MKRLHGTGLGVSKKQAEPISPDEEAILWAKGLFGTHNAQVHTNTLCICKVFYNEHRNLKLRNLKLLTVYKESR